MGLPMASAPNAATLAHPRADRRPRRGAALRFPDFQFASRTGDDGADSPRVIPEI